LSLLNLPWSELLRKELAGLTAGRAFWVLLLVQSLLTGLTYAQAVSLYSEMSRTALAAPELAAGLSPLEHRYLHKFLAL
jgi:hypothetical protein